MDQSRRFIAPGQNRLLSALSRELQIRLLPRMEKVNLAVRQVLFEANEPLTHVYFPLSGAMSLLIALASGETDALVWITSFDGTRQPPASNVPTIVLTRPGMQMPCTPPAVLIEVATPGVDHAGHFCRGDTVVAVRLRRLVSSSLPSVAEVVAQIGAVMRAGT